MYKALAITILASALSFFGAGVALADPQLVMAEQDGCVYCAQWDAEIGHIYDKTGEGQAAPLRRIDKNAPLPVDMTLSRPVVFTPTFILLIDGIETARIEGYPGADFFWGLLGDMLAAHDIPFVIKEQATPGKT